MLLSVRSVMSTKASAEKCDAVLHKNSICNFALTGIFSSTQARLQRLGIRYEAVICFQARLQGGSIYFGKQICHDGSALFGAFYAPVEEMCQFGEDRVQAALFCTVFLNSQ